MPSQAGDPAAYQPVHPRAMREFLSHIPGDRGSMTFVDIGSGRGRALFLAVEAGFGRVIGIENQQAHHHLAVTNVEHYRRRGAAIELVLGDARDFAFPSGPLVLFLYNPFGAEALAQIVDRFVVTASRPAWLIYEAPLQRAILDANPALDLVAERTARAGASPRRPRFAIYRLRT